MESGRADGTALSLAAAAREQLGLGAQDSVRIAALTPLALLLELRGADAPSLPAERTISLLADVRCLPMAELLGWVHGAGKSGLLHFADEGVTKAVYLHRGEVIFAASNQRIDRLGHSLVRAGVITLEQLREAERAFNPPQRFGKALVERGAVSPRELWAGLQRQVAEIVRSLFFHPTGIACFWDGDVQPDNVVRLSLPTQRLVEEGLRWRDELARFVETLSQPRVRLESVPDKRDCVSGAERVLFDALREESSFASVCHRAGFDPATAARTIQLLHRAGAVRMRRAVEDPDCTQRVRGEEPARLARAAAKLIDELLVPLIAAEGVEPVRARFAQAVAEVAVRFPELLGGLEPGASGGLDPEQLAERALVAGTDPAQTTREALGGLVEYLEFELKNHPAIEDADGLLAGAEPLRASIRS